MERNKLAVASSADYNQIRLDALRCKSRERIRDWPRVEVKTYGNGNGNGNGVEALASYAIEATPKQRTPAHSITKDEAKEPPSAELQSTFVKLAEQWRKETGHLSSMQAMVMSQPYQNIIGLGEPVVWLLLEELKTRPDHWFWALAHITRDNPVPIEHSGNLMLMRADWLEWGKQHGYP